MTHALSVNGRAILITRCFELLGMGSKFHGFADRQEPSFLSHDVCLGRGGDRLQTPRLRWRVGVRFLGPLRRQIGWITGREHGIFGLMGPVLDHTDLLHLVNTVSGARSFSKLAGAGSGRRRALDLL